MSIDRGVPVIAWQPMTQAQRDQGIGAFEWGLLVSYNEQQKTYAVRHPRDKTEYTVPFGGFGYTDPVNWYHVIVPVEPEPADLQQVAIQSLKHAVAFAHGDRYDMANICYPTDALGFAAYELWLDSFQTENVDPHFASVHDDANQALHAAITFYEEEVHVLDQLTEICQRAATHSGFTASLLQEATGSLQAALEADRNAIMDIEAALAVLQVSIS
jgi:hypothetical protein